MSDLSIRLAKRSDAPLALALWRALHAEHEAQDARYRMSDDAPLRWSTDFRDWTQSPSHRIWLAEAPAGTSGSRRTVGLLTAHLYQPAPTFAPYTMVYVDDLYVVPTFRGRRVAVQLLDHARTWGREQGAVEIRAGVLAANALGRAFWTRQGADDFYVTVTAPL